MGSFCCQNQLQWSIFFFSGLPLQLLNKAAIVSLVVVFPTLPVTPMNTVVFWALVRAAIPSCWSASSGFGTSKVGFINAASGGLQISSVLEDIFYKKSKLKFNQLRFARETRVELIEQKLNFKFTPTNRWAFFAT